MASERTMSPSNDRAGAGRAFLNELRRVRQQRWGNPWGYVFIAPAMVLYLVFNIWPIIRGLLMAFTDYRFLIPDSRWEFNGIENFREMAKDDLFWFSLGVSLNYSFWCLPTMYFMARPRPDIKTRDPRAAHD